MQTFSPYFFVLSLLVSINLFSFDHSHSAWNAILQKHVVMKEHSSAVKYKELKTQSETLDSYLESLTSVKQKAFSSWTESQQQAFLINAYNAFTLKLVIDHYPVKSIKDSKIAWFSPWKKKFFNLLGKERYLDWIEHEKLRKDYEEPRIHFAVNCASIGCPALQNKAFTSENLDSLLDSGMKSFLTDSSRNYVSKKSKEIHISKIFDWFEEDFTKKGSSVEKFIANYISDDEKVRKEIKAGKYKIKYTSYDWNLNESK